MDQSQEGTLLCNTREKKRDTVVGEARLSTKIQFSAPGAV